MNEQIRSYLAEIGRRGGRKSRRVLDAQTAAQMVRIREARRAYKKFHAQCFWSYNPRYKIGRDDVRWVAEELMKNGGRTGFLVGAKLCR